MDYTTKMRLRQKFIQMPYHSSSNDGHWELAYDGFRDGFVFDAWQDKYHRFKVFHEIERWSHHAAYKRLYLGRFITLDHGFAKMERDVDSDAEFEVLLMVRSHGIPQDDMIRMEQLEHDIYQLGCDVMDWQKQISTAKVITRDYGREYAIQQVGYDICHMEDIINALNEQLDEAHAELDSLRQKHRV